METATFRNPRLVVLVLLVIISAGLSAFLSLGRQEDPTITNINALITTVYPGSDPVRVESLVTQKIEDALRTIPEINNIFSSSSTGFSAVSVELMETVATDQIEQIWSKARDVVADTALDFPPGAQDPDFSTDGLSAYAAIYALQPTGDTAFPAIMGRMAKSIAVELRNVRGTKLVELYGEPEEEVLVSLDLAEIAALGLTPDLISGAIVAADAKVQSGRHLSATTDMVLDVQGEIDTLERLHRIVVREDGLGGVTRLGDVAEISRGPRAPSTALALSDGKEAILIAVQVDEGMQIDVWNNWLDKEVADFASRLPAFLAVEKVFDQGEYTKNRLADVALNMAIGVGLVIAVLMVTLGLRSALIVAVVLPLVSLATVTTMNIIGLPIHQMSVTGLIVALGLLVDAAIVMTDEVGRGLEAGVERVQAVGQAVRRLVAPLLASTLTTAFSFMPMILLPGPSGDFVGSIAMAVVLMLIWSFLIAILITPAIAGWGLPEKGKASRFSGGIASGSFGRVFRASLLWSVHNPIKSVSLALVLPITGFNSTSTLTAQFFPGVDRDQFHIEVDLKPGTPINVTHVIALEMDAALRATDGIEQVSWSIGESAPAFYYNIVGGRQNSPTFAQALIRTASPARTAELLTPLQQQLDANFPSARVLVRGLVQGPPVAAPVEFRLIGPDLGTLRDLGESARSILIGVDDITSVRTGLEGGAPKAEIDINEEAARLLGLDLAGIARQLQSGLEGIVGGSLIEASEQLPVRVQLGGGLRGDLSRISNMNIVPPNALQLIGKGIFPAIPLSAVANVALVPSDSTISRRNGERLNTVQAFIKPGVLPEEARQSAERALAEMGFSLPEGYRMQFGGDADARSQTVNNLISSLGIIVTLSIATVVLTFGSFRLSAIAFGVAALSSGLSFLSLATFGYPFGITAIIGIIGAIGVSINAAIIILTGLQQNPEASGGNRQAIVDVVMGSSRHILSTTLTTFGGFLPLIVAGGGFWPPFATSIAGGVLLSTVVSFYFTPQMFALLGRPGNIAKVGEEETKPKVSKLLPKVLVKPCKPEPAFGKVA